MGRGEERDRRRGDEKRTMKTGVNELKCDVRARLKF